MLPPTALTDTTTTTATTGVNPNRTRRPSTTGSSHSAGSLSTFDRSRSFSSSVPRRSSNDISPGFASTKASIDADVAVVPSSLDRLINKPFGRAASFTNGNLSTSTDHHQQHQPQHHHQHQPQQHYIIQPNDIPEHINTPPFHSSSPLTHSTWRPSESLFPPTHQHQYPQSQHSNLFPPSGSPFSQTDGSSPNHRSQLTYSQHSLYAHHPSTSHQPTSHRLTLSSAPTMTSLTATPVASSSTTNATTTTTSSMISTNNTQPMPTYKSNQHLGPPPKRPLRMLQEGDKEVIDLEDTTSGESEDESEDEEISVVIERPEFEAFLTEDIKPDLAFFHQNGNSHLERKGKDLSIELNDDVNMSDDVDDDDDDEDEEDDEDEDDEDEDEGRPARLSSSSAAAASATNTTNNITVSTINAPFPSALSTPATIGLGLSLVDDTHQATAPILLGSSIALATNSTVTSAGLPSEPTPSGLLLSPIDDGTPIARPNSATLSGTSLTLGLATPPIVNTDSDSASGPVSATAVATNTAPVAVVASKRKRKRTPSPSPPPAPVKPDITLRLEHTLDGPASEFSLYDRAYEMEFYDEDTMENFSLRGMLGGLWAEEEEEDEDGNDDEEGGTEEERLARELEKRYGNKKTSAVSIKKKSKDNEYDITDAFVDDSTQGIDEPHFSGIPAKPGFYVCRGDVVLQGEEKNPITLIPSTKPKPAKKAASVVSANATLPIPLSTPASVPSPAPVSTSASHTLLAHSASAPALSSSSVSSSGPADPAVSQPSKAKKPKLDGRPTEENILQPRPKPKSRPSSTIAPSAVSNSAVPGASTSANSTLNANANTGSVGGQMKPIPPSTESSLPFSSVVAPSGSGPDPNDPLIVSAENDHSSSSAAAAATASLQGKPSKVGAGPVSVVTGTGSASAPFDVDKSDEIEIVKPTPSPALREKLDELKKQVKKENWTNKAKFPPKLKPVLLDVAKTALLTGFYGESLFELMPTIFPYNKFTMTKLIKREIYEFHDGLLQIKRRDLLEEFANEINRVKEDVFEKYERSLQQWEETQKKKQVDKESGEGSEIRPGTPSTLIMDSPGHHAQASSVSASVDPGSPNSRSLGPLPPDSAPPATTTGAHTPTGYTPNHSTIPLPPPGTPPSRQPVEDKPPSRKFRFNERMKDLLTQLMDVTSDTLTLANEKARYEGGQEKHLLPLNRALYADMNKLFPPGWVQNTQISREVSFIKKRKTRSEGKNTPVELV